MKTTMEEAIKVVSEIAEVMTEEYKKAKERYDNRTAHDLLITIEAIKLIEGNLVMRNEPLTQSAGEAV